jgi:hypothetical protein
MEAIMLAEVVAVATIWLAAITLVWDRMEVVMAETTMVLVILPQQVLPTLVVEAVVVQQVTVLLTMEVVAW